MKPRITFHPNPPMIKGVDYYTCAGGGKVISGRTMYEAYRMWNNAHSAERMNKYYNKWYDSIKTSKTI